MNVKLQKWDAVVAIYILTAFIMLIVPLPAWILDVFMACLLYTSDAADE